MSSVAVIVPVYQRVAALANCLASLEAGTRTPDEIIVVSDGNTPEDTAQIKDISGAARAHVIILNFNVGAAVARNHGARQTHADYLFFCDADVVLEPDALERLVAALDDHPDAAFAYGDFVFDEVVMRGRPFDGELLKKHNYISTMSLVRRSAFSEFDGNLKRFQDWDLWLTIARAGGVGVYAPGILFRTRSGGTMSTRIPSFMTKHPRWFRWIPRVDAYVVARTILFNKHGLK